MCAPRQPLAVSSLKGRSAPSSTRHPLQTRYRWRPALASLAVGSGFFFLGALFDIVLKRHGMGTPAILVGDLLAGIAAGLVVLRYEQRRQRELIRRLEIIRLMNHHVRNSLQVIAYASSGEDRAQHVEKVRNAIERIDWALREVLPGKRKQDSHGA
jgi:ABC-type Fe3+-siderophore transport system permease subunit